jgi:hypothetical protein
MFIEGCICLISLGSYADISLREPMEYRRSSRQAKGIIRTGFMEIIVKRAQIEGRNRTPWKKSAVALDHLCLTRCEMRESPQTCRGIPGPYKARETPTISVPARTRRTCQYSSRYPVGINFLERGQAFSKTLKTTCALVSGFARRDSDPWSASRARVPSAA